ncbi:MAG TPA: NADH-quinone oxidoreductase subunit F, partial [Limnochordia bacterium]|nr:NADH-quinone oxidoreductase subunit F [Limnochordia bacterium]
MANKQYTIKVGLASCGIAAGAQQVYDEFLSKLSQQEAALDAALILTGCLGMCYCEPLVEVSTKGHERYLYGNVAPEDVELIINQHLFGGEPVKELLVYAPNLDPEMDRYMEKQVRIALQNCGVVNPEDIASYMAAGGYQGLQKALRLGSEGVIA